MTVSRAFSFVVVQLELEKQSLAAAVNKLDLCFNWRKNANKVETQQCFDVVETCWRTSKSKAAATGLTGTSALMFHSVTVTESCRGSGGWRDTVKTGSETG